MAKQTTDRGWQVGKPLADRLYHMLENEVDCDVTFMFPHSEPPFRLHAHKVVLKAGSPVFEAMFSGNFREDFNDVEIVDIAPTVFKEVLRFMYADTAEVTAENVVPLMFAAKKYMLDDVANKCAGFLADKIDANNVCQLLNDSLDYANELLTKTCLEFICQATENVLSTTGFADLSKNALRFIVEAKDLVVGNEIDLYRACIRWAQNQDAAHVQTDSQLRNDLEECIHEIRFHQMSPGDFAGSVANAGVLTEREKNNFFTFFIKRDEDTKQLLENCGFNMSVRGNLPMVTVQCCISGDVLKYGMIDESESLRFAYVSGPALQLQAIYVYGGKSNGERHSISFTLSPSKAYLGEMPGRPLLHDEGEIQSSGDRRPIRIDVHGHREPLAPGQCYKLALHITGPPTYFRTGPREKFKLGNLHFVFSPLKRKNKLRIAELVFSRVC